MSAATLLLCLAGALTWVGVLAFVSEPSTGLLVALVAVVGPFVWVPTVTGLEWLLKDLL